MDFKVKLLTLMLILLRINSTFSYQKSFSIVIDTSASMDYELDAIKDNIQEVLNFVNKDYVYISVPFKQGTVIATTVRYNSTKFLSDIHGITTNEEDGVCVENVSLMAIESALHAGYQDPNSYVFVFTDAPANVTENLNIVQDSCRNTKNQVIIILTGTCPQSQGANDTVYFEVARSCNGGVYQFDPVLDMRKAFTLIKEIVKTDWNDIKTHDYFTGEKRIEISVESYTKELMVAVYGKDCSLQFDNAFGLRYTDVLHTPFVKVIRFTNYKVGTYMATVRSQGLTSITVYKNQDDYSPIHYIGFSLKRTHFRTLTSTSPIPGFYNDILIIVDVPHVSNLKLHHINIQFFKTSKSLAHNTLSLELKEDSEHKGHYYCKEFFDHSTKFYITISGDDVANHSNFTENSKIIEPQKTLWGQAKVVPDSRPVVEIIAIQPIPTNALVDSGSNLTFACKTTAYPKPEVTWRGDEGIRPENIMTIEVPNVFVSYATLYNLRNNVTISCTARNTKGEDSKNLELFVKRTFSFHVIRRPLDQTIEYGAERRLYCEVQAFPEATITWYHNDTQLDYFTPDNIEIGSGNQELLIKHMDLKNVGTYRCEVKSGYETYEYEAKIEISGLNAPQIELQSAKVTVKPGDQTEFECIVKKGIPTSDVSWRYKTEDGFSFGATPLGVDVENGKIKIFSAKLEHAGIYRCEASNVVGQDYKDVTVKVQFAPEIELEPNELFVKPGDWKEVNCAVRGMPTPVLTWKYKAEDAYSFGTVPGGVDVKNGKITISSVRTEHAGIYRCEASNVVGQDFRDVTVKIQYAPEIIQLTEALTVNEDDKVELKCEVDAIPEATVRWELYKNNYLVDLEDRHKIDEHHTLRFNAFWKDTGDYHCIAENLIGKTEKSTAVNVLVVPFIEPPKNNNITILLETSLELECNVLYGNPAPSIRWEFLSLRSPVKSVLSRGSPTLRLSSILKQDEGLYICIADNGLGIDSIKIDLHVASTPNN